MTASVTAARRELRFPSGKTLWMSPLTDRDIEELDNWVQARYIDNARKSLSKDATAQEREETLRVAMDGALVLSWLSGLGAKLLATVPGMAMLAFQSCRANHPGLTYEEVRQEMLSPESVRAVESTFNQLNSMRASDNPQRARRRAEKKRRRRDRRGRKHRD